MIKNSLVTKVKNNILLKEINNAYNEMGRFNSKGDLASSKMMENELNDLQAEVIMTNLYPITKFGKTYYNNNIYSTNYKNSKFNTTIKRSKNKNIYSLNKTVKSTVIQNNLANNNINNNIINEENNVEEEENNIEQKNENNNINNNQDDNIINNENNNNNQANNDNNQMNQAESNNNNNDNEVKEEMVNNKENNQNLDNINNNINDINNINSNSLKKNGIEQSVHEIHNVYDIQNKDQIEIINKNESINNSNIPKIKRNNQQINKEENNIDDNYENYEDRNAQYEFGENMYYDNEELEDVYEEREEDDYSKGRRLYGPRRNIVEEVIEETKNNNGESYIPNNPNYPSFNQSVPYNIPPKGSIYPNNSMNNNKYPQFNPEQMNNNGPNPESNNNSYPNNQTFNPSQNTILILIPFSKIFLNIQTLHILKIIPNIKIHNIIQTFQNL